MGIRLEISSESKKERGVCVCVCVNVIYLVALATPDKFVIRSLFPAQQFPDRRQPAPPQHREDRSQAGVGGASHLLNMPSPLNPSNQGIQTPEPGRSATP